MGYQGGAKEGRMGFGRYPHVAKAEAAQAKAREAKDVVSEVRAYLEAAHLWDRAAAKEKDGKRRTEYEANAAAARERSTEAEQKPAPSAAALAAQLKVLRGGKDG
jgi:hypothetical protein